MSGNIIIQPIKCPDGMIWDQLRRKCVPVSPSLPGPPSAAGCQSDMPEWVNLSKDGTCPVGYTKVLRGGIAGNFYACHCNQNTKPVRPEFPDPNDVGSKHRKLWPSADGTCPPGYALLSACVGPGADPYNPRPSAELCCVWQGGIDPPPPPPDPDDKQCCSEGELCDGLTDILERIVKTQEDIAKILADGWGDCDKLLTKCEDELTEFIERKIDIELKKFADCQRKAAAGLCGTAEYEQQCAKYALECAGDECYEEGIGNKPGPCKGCGKEPCCCNEGKCEPCEEEPEKEGEWRGWCDPVTQLVYALRKDAGPPTPTAIPTGLSDTEQNALGLASQLCRTYPPPPPPDTGYGDIPATLSTVGCNLSGYADNSNLIRLRQMVNSQDYDAGINRVYRAASDIGIAGLTIDDLGEIVQGALQSTIGVSPILVRESAKLAGKLIGCDSEGIIAAITSYSAFGMIEKMTGANLSGLTAPYIYSIQANCRNKFLDPDKAIAAYLGNGLSRAELETQLAIHGWCPEAIVAYEKAAVAKPIPLELMNMKLRGIIAEKDYYAGMRRLGYTERQDATNLLKLRQQLPTMADILHFMVRDADDPNVVNTFNLDFGFTDKYQAQLKEWADQQGVPEKAARYAWRSHWTIPNPTQLFQFWRRLRKDPQFGGEDGLWKNITDALVQQDILPFWHEHFKAINFLPLGRVDIRRMFNIGSVDEADLEGLYQQLGYSDDDAKRQKKFAIRDRNNSIVRHQIVKLWLDWLIDRDEASNRLNALDFPDAEVQEALDKAQYQFDDSLPAAAYVRGQLTRAEFEAELTNQGVTPGAIARIIGKLSFRISPVITIRQYNAGITNRQAASNLMIQQGMHAQIVNNVLDDADKEQKTAQVMDCRRAIKRRYIYGDIDKVGAQAALTAAGVDNQRAIQIVDGWACELVSKGKDAPIPRLCEWLARGAIGPQDFLDRLKRLGWNAVDAGMIMEDCLISVNAKRNAEAKRQAKEDAAVSAAQQRKGEQAAARAAQAINALERGRKQAQATVDRRQRQLLSAAEKIIKKCECPLQRAYAYAMNTNKRLQSEYALSKDDSLQALITAVDGWDGLSFDDLDASVALAASLLQVTETSESDSAGIAL